MDYIDTRDLIARESELDLALELAEEQQLDDDKLEIEEEQGEIDDIRNAVSEFNHGETLIPAEEFENYARELAEDKGAISGDEGWPLSHIDWAKAAHELEADYVEVEYQGTAYLARNCYG